MRIQAILLDLDGVLVDATEWHYKALNRALELFGFQITRFEHLSTYNGLPTRKKLEMLSVEKGLPVALHDLLSRLKQVYTREEILLQCWPVFEKEYMLSRLKQEGYRLAVCSNAIRDSVELMLRRSSLFDYLEFVISNEDVTKPKPDPEIYLKAIERMKIRPKEALVVEDAPYGIESAKRAGIHVCQVSGYDDVDYGRVRDYLDALEARETSKC